MTFGPDVRWRKSSYSDGGGGECVEVAVEGAAVGVRDSKNSAGPVLVLDSQSWEAFRSAVTQG